MGLLHGHALRRGLRHLILVFRSSSPKTKKLESSSIKYHHPCLVRPTPGLHTHGHSWDHVWLAGTTSRAYLRGWSCWWCWLGWWPRAPPEHSQQEAGPAFLVPHGGLRGREWLLPLLKQPAWEAGQNRVYVCCFQYPKSWMWITVALMESKIKVMCTYIPENCSGWIL